MAWIDRTNRIKTLTLNDVLKTVTNAELYANTGVTDAEAELINDHFLYSRINSADTEKFMWFFRRNLRRWYPVYKDQMEAWAKYKALDFFYDNVNKITETYTGTTTEARDISDEFVSDVRRALDVIGKTTTTQTTDTDTTSNTESRTDVDESDSYVDNTSSKNREFGFAYPEANYQGGVIPYDLSDNPSVEFITSQTDGIGQGTTNHSGDFEGRTDYMDSASGTVDTTMDTDTETTNDTDETTNTTSNRNTDSDMQGTQDYVKTIESPGIYALDIAHRLIEILPLTDFWNQFMRNMSICFNCFFSENFPEESIFFD